MKNVSLLDLVTIRMHIVVVLAKVFNYLDIYQSSLFLHFTYYCFSGTFIVHNSSGGHLNAGLGVVPVFENQ